MIVCDVGGKRGGKYCEVTLGEGTVFHCVHSGVESLFNTMIGWINIETFPKTISISLTWFAVLTDDALWRTILFCQWVRNVCKGIYFALCWELNSVGHSKIVYGLDGVEVCGIIFEGGSEHCGQMCQERDELILPENCVTSFMGNPVYVQRGVANNLSLVYVYNMCKVWVIYSVRPIC